MTKLNTDPTTYRATFSLPAELAMQISEVAAGLRITQSALVSHLLAGPLGQLAIHLTLAVNSSAPDEVEARRRSAHVSQLIEDALAESAQQRFL